MGRKAFNYETIPLCPYHHRQGPFGEAVHNGTKSFETKYGSQREMLEVVLSLISQSEFMPELPKHHYIPVFYLKQWALRDKRLIAFTRPHGDKVVFTPKSPKSTGYHRGLYWLEGADPSIANRIEEILMGRIDNNAAIAHQIILRNDITSLPKLVRLAWARFIVGLLIRSPAQVKNVYN